MKTLRSLLQLLCLVLPLVVVAGCSCQGDDDDSATPAPEPEVEHDWGYYVDMDIDSQGRVWLAYQEADDKSLVAARGTGDPVEFEHWTVDGHGEVVNGILMGAFDAGNYASIAVDGNDAPHIAHWDADADKLKYSTRAGDAWENGTIDDGGRFASLGIVDGNAPIVSYYAGGKLKVAVWLGAGWSHEVVDEGTAPEVPEGDPEIEADVGQYSNLLVASDGTVYVAYYDLANGDLKVARGGPDAWTIETWASEGDVGAWPNMTEHDGAIWVAFQDVENKDLLLGRWLGAELVVELVDDSDFVGADSAMAWVGETKAIMYHDGVHNDAKLALDDGGGWVVTTHMADGAVGFFNNLAATSTGDLQWACFDHTRSEIVFQRFTP
jgi:hypothetical protein